MGHSCCQKRIKKGNICKYYEKAAPVWRQWMGEGSESEIIDSTSVLFLRSEEEEYKTPICLRKIGREDGFRLSAGAAFSINCLWGLRSLPCNQGVQVRYPIRNRIQINLTLGDRYHSMEGRSRFALSRDLPSTYMDKQQCLLPYNHMVSGSIAARDTSDGEPKIN